MSKKSDREARKALQDVHDSIMHDATDCEGLGCIVQAPEAPEAPEAIGVKRVYTFQRHRTSADGYTHQLGACAHAAFTSPGKGVVYVPLHMLAVPPVAGDTLALAVSTVPIDGHTLHYSATTGNDARKRYNVPGHTGSVVIHATQLPVGAMDPNTPEGLPRNTASLWCSLALALPNVPRVTLARDTVAIVADAAMRIAVAAGRTIPTDDDLTAAKHAIGV